MGINPYRNPSISGIAEIFETYPQLQNEFSSMWYFFVLFPKQGEAFGPKQLMFSFASKVGRHYGVGGKWQKGMKLINGDPKVRKFMTTAVGWCFDGENIHEDLVHQDVLASVSKDGWVRGWVETDDGSKYGGEIIAPDLNEEKLNVHFNGEDGYGKFQVWAEDDWEMSRPLNFDNVTKLYSSLLIAWRKFSFKGKFGYNSTEEQLEGYGYFQRVCVNLPTMPWYWPILMFPDGSIFSSFQPYFGANCLRARDRVRHRLFRKLRINVASSAYFADNTNNSITTFKESFVREKPGSTDEDLRFEIVSRNLETGDYVKIETKSLAETGWDLEKRLFTIFQNLWNYNEHIVEVVRIEGRINGRILNDEGKIFGNTEYCWGMSI
ncbi:MAG: hypothetical protein INQ03_11470 [Candidatus Heimdallarchaeota archaeon]|nr:hypothetical protein [Candidatus Heimdallarchaeota archaeon]